MPPQNQPNPGGMFSRYQSEQINQIPAGYVEGMSSYGRMAQQVGTNIATMMAQNRAEEQQTKQNTLKTGENQINERKVAAAERANVIKEGQADTEATYKAYTAVLAADEAGYKRVEASNKALDSQLQFFKDVQSDPKASAQQKEEANKKILELTPLKKKALEGFNKYLESTPPTYEQFLSDRTKAGSTRPVLRHPDGTRNMMQAPATAPEKAPGTPTSYYTSPAFNPAPVTGEAQGVTKTVAVGGSAKKVELVGGRVSSVVSSEGKKTTLNNYLPESSVDAAVEFASKFFPSPVSVKAFTGAEPAPATAVERIETPGPLNNKIVETEPMKAIPTSMTASVPVNGTIVFDEQSDSAGTITRTPRIKFNTRTLTNADGSESETGVRSLRQLTLINEVLKGGSYKLVEPTQEERDSARDLFGTEENAFDLPVIAKAWAVVKRNTDKTAKGFDSTANNFSLKFQDQFGMFPSQFLANGEQANLEEITPDASVALERTQSARLASRFADIGLQPGKPPGLQDSITFVDNELRETTEKIEKLGKWLKNPLIIGSDVETAYKNELATEMKKLTAIEARAKQNQIVISNWEAENKAWESKRNSIEQELKADKLVQDLQTGRIEQSKAVEKFAERWIGAESQHLEMTNGFVASKLRTLRSKTGAIPLVNKNGEPIMTKDRFGNTVQKVYQDRLDAPEYLQYLIANGKYKEVIELSRGMPDEDNIRNPKTGILDAQFKFKESIKPLRELNAINDKYIAMSQSGATGEAQSYWKKMWYDSEDAAGQSLQKSLIGKIREAIVGPGNPSNYEQEVITSIVPNPTDFFTRPERQQARIRALATISILNHYNRMVANKLEITPESYKMYTDQLGSVLGFPVNEAFFTGLQEDYMRSKVSYGNNEGMNNENKSIAAAYGARLLDTLEANVKAQNEARVTGKKGK
jgi:hypothetical protein